MREDIIDHVKAYLIEKYDCHALILYGSFENETYTDESDIDIIGFCDKDERQNDTNIIDTRQLDAWIYPTEMMERYEELLHIHAGKILWDERQLCCKLLEGINKLFNGGAKALRIEQIDFQ